MTTNSYLVLDTRDGRQICQCGSIGDAETMVSFDPQHRAYRRNLLVLDQVIDVPSVRLDDDLRLNPQRILFNPDGEPLNLTL